MLDKKTKQTLKAKAHKLKPVVLLGNSGLTANVKMEIDRALNDHELIKIKITTDDRDLKHELISEIATSLDAQLIQTIGHIAILFRKSKKE